MTYAEKLLDPRWQIKRFILDMMARLDSEQLDEIAGYVKSISGSSAPMPTMPGLGYFRGELNGSQPRLSDDELLEFIIDAERGTKNAAY